MPDLAEDDLSLIDFIRKISALSIERCDASEFDQLLAQRSVQPRNRFLGEVICLLVASRASTRQYFIECMSLVQLQVSLGPLACIDSTYAWFLKRQGVVPTTWRNRLVK